MNYLGLEVDELKEFLTADLLQLAKKQVYLNSLRRNNEGSLQVQEIEKASQEVLVLQQNINQTRLTLDLLTANMSPDKPLLRERVQVPSSLPSLNVQELGNRFDIEDFIEVFESRLESSDVPRQQWSSILLSTVPPTDLATLCWIKEHVLPVDWSKAKSDTRTSVRRHGGRYF